MDVIRICVMSASVCVCVDQYNYNFRHNMSMCVLCGAYPRNTSRWSLKVENSWSTIKDLFVM